MAGRCMLLRQRLGGGVPLLEVVDRILQVLVALHLELEPGIFRPEQLAELGRLVKTLHRVFTLLETQREKSRIKRFFKQSENAALFKSCQAELQDILDTLKLENAGLVETISSVENDFVGAHEIILQRVQAETASLSTLSGASSSSPSVFSLIPPNPQIFHGREIELADTIHLFIHNTNPRVVILGPGGIGKTSLARAVLHHPEVQKKYPPETCVYTACDTATGVQDILVSIATHLGIKPGRNLRADIAYHLTEKAQHLLVLDNLETVWEPLDIRRDLENVLAFFAGLTNVALLITMRGAERPAEVIWTRPFLPPLEPLHQDAALQTVLDIIDEPGILEADSKIDAVLALTGNIPLAITLMAYLLRSESSSSILSRWQEDKTTVLSDGIDKRSNLDISIAISLASPRMKSNPEAHKLLQVLSALPDGLHEHDLNYHIIPIDNPLKCKSTLLRTSLAYLTPAKRLNLLAPIREYMKENASPPMALLHPIFLHYSEILKLSVNSYGIEPSRHLRAQSEANFSNIQSLLAFRMSTHISPGDAAEIVPFGILASRYHAREGYGQIPFIVETMAKPTKLFDADEGGAQLKVSLIVEQLETSAVTNYKQFPNAAQEIQHAISLFPEFHNNLLKAELFQAAADFSLKHERNIPLAECWLEKALALSEPESYMRAVIYTCQAEIHWDREDFTSGLQLSEIAQRIYRQNGNLRGEAKALLSASKALFGLRAYTKASEVAAQARKILVLCELPGSSTDLALLNLLGEVHREKSEYLEAQAAYQEILRLWLAAGRQPDAILLTVQLNLCLTAIAMDLSGAAHNHLVAARQTAARLNYGPWWDICHVLGALCLVQEGKFNEAKPKLQQWCLGDWDWETERLCLECLADPDVWTIKSYSRESAYILLAHTSSGARLVQSRIQLYKALHFLGCAMLIEGDNDSAHNLFVTALEGLTRYDSHCSIAECSVKLAGITEKSGNTDKALQLLNTARCRFGRSGQAVRRQRVEQKIKEIERKRIGVEMKSTVSIMTA